MVRAYVHVKITNFLCPPSLTEAGVYLNLFSSVIELTSSVLSSNSLRLYSAALIVLHNVRLRQVCARERKFRTPPGPGELPKRMPT